jgi:GT2 family glycosyltransferase
MRTLLSLIIPTYQGLHLLQSTLEKNLAQFSEIPGFECIVVDDASDDGTVLWLKTHFPDVITIVAPQNKGFAHTVNLGAARATGEFLFFLNNDMQIMNVDLDLAFKVLREENVFALVPTIVRPSKDNAFESYTWGKFAGGWFSAESYLPHGSLRASIVDAQPSNIHRAPSGEGVGGGGIPILWACGGAMLVSREKYEVLGGFDTLYSPFYFEDLDLSYRAWKRGWESRYMDFALLHHQHQATIGTLFKTSAVEHIHRAHHYLFMWKNLDDIGFLFSHFLTVLVKILTFQLRDIMAIATALTRLPRIISYRRTCLRSVLKDAEILKKVSRTWHRDV